MERNKFLCIALSLIVVQIMTFMTLSYSNNLDRSNDEIITVAHQTVSRKPVCRG